MRLIRAGLAAAAIATLWWYPAAAADPAAQARIEGGLLPAVTFGEAPAGWTVEARMARWNVPGASIAVIDDGDIAWAGGYGVLAADGATPVTPETRFQAASISKPVAAVAALALVEDGVLTLDGDAASVIRRWTLPANAFTAERPLTLKDLLSHTGGLSVHGFGGYPQGADLPTLPDILAGRAPANSAAVVVQTRPGAGWRYSGGGYQIVELMIEDATGRDFAEIVRERVLVPAGMTSSGYETPLEGAFAFGHDSNGGVIPGGWNRYPERAAAGLWTTPTDLARFAIALSAAWEGAPDRVLSPGMTATMLTPILGGYGLGTGLRGEGETLAVSHGGANEGFRAFWVIHPATGDGAVVMTNGDAGDRLAMEMIRATAAAYGWPDFAPDRMERFALAPEALQARVGNWSTSFEGETLVFTLRAEGEDLVIETPRGTMSFTPVSETRMVSGETGMGVEFVASAGGPTVLRAFGLELIRETAPGTLDSPPPATDTARP